MTSPSPDDTAKAILICLVGGPLVVSAVWAVGCLYSVVYNMIRGRK